MRAPIALIGVAALLASAGRQALAAEKASAARAQVRISPGLVDGAQARALVADGVKVVDVRTASEFAAGHVPGAVNIPYDQLGRRAGELGPASTPLLLYCRTGRRSGIAVATLNEKGFARLYDLQAFERWVASEPRK
jgi:rhodanese-related sulfurtransferase